MNESQLTPLVSASTARSQTGAIAVSTSFRGLPIAMRIDDSELRKPPNILAEEIFGLCRLAAIRAQLEFRRRLGAKPVDTEALIHLDLATGDDLSGAEDALVSDDTLPTTWLRSI